MKVTFSCYVKTYSGYGDNNVYSRWLDGKLCIMRNYKYPRLTAHNAHMGLIAQNLSRVFADASVGYLADFTRYRDLRKLINRTHNPARMKQIAAPFGLFIDMMFAWHDSDPAHVDLTAVTIADIVSSDADVRTVARAIDAGFLKKVYPYTGLDKDIQTV